MAMPVLVKALVPVLLAASGGIQPGERVRIGSPGEVEISGHLEGAPFRCVSQQVSGGGALHAASGTYSSIPPMRAFELRVPVDSFACTAREVTGRFRQALQDGRHPMLRFQLRRFETLPGPGGQTFRVQAEGQLTAGGRQLPVQIPISGEGMSDGSLHLSGTFQLAPQSLGVPSPREPVTIAFRVQVRSENAPPLLAPDGNPPVDPPAKR